MINRIPADLDKVQVVAMQDPVTGQLIEKVVHTIIDEKTGQMKQIPLDLPKGIITNNHIKIYFLHKQIHILQKNLKSPFFVQNDQRSNLTNLRLGKLPFKIH